MIDFTRFEIVGSDGNTYHGIRPSLVPKPFKSICYRCSSGQIIYPPPPLPKNEPIWGYDGSFQVISTGFEQMLVRVRLTTILKNKTRIFSLFTLEGALIKTETTTEV